MKFRIRNVDVYGYNGRDNHPSKTDEGLIVTLVRATVHFAHPDGCESLEDILAGKTTVRSSDVLPFLGPGSDELEGECYIETCLTCVTADGRLLDMMEFELEAI